MVTRKEIEKELLGMIPNETEEKEKDLEETNTAKKDIDEIKILLGSVFEDLKEVIKRYVKLKDEYYDILAVWIIGTYCIKSFNTFPYLFINAQKGSGKTRLLKLLEKLAHNGELLASMREAVLFRIANDDKTILIDELEGLDRKENAPLKELLNACYKRGTKVYRMRKKGDDYVAEAFYPFTPIAIANIGGVDDVLGDRCITIHLDKSIKSSYSLLQEDFEDSLLIKDIKERLKSLKKGLCSLCSAEYTQKTWNMYIIFKYNINTYNTYNTHNTLKTHKTENNFSVVCVDQNFENLRNDVVSNYNKIHDSGINGRHLELVFPLLIVSLMLNEDVFDKILNFSIEMTKVKKDDDITESNDISLIDFVSKMKDEIDYDKFRFVHELTERFRYFMGIRDKREQEEINSRWFGRALKRLGLVVEKRRLSAGVEVKLNISKAIKLLGELK